MYILAKGDKYMADDKNFPSNVSLTKNIKDAYVFTEYREAEWIANMTGLEVRRYGQEETEAQSGLRTKV